MPPHTPNSYCIDREIAIIDLTQDQATQIDVADLERVLRWRWAAQWSAHTRNYYAVTTCLAEDGDWMGMSLHVLLMDFPDGRVIDHANGDTLDNRRQNLRVVTYAQNAQNRAGAQRGSTTGVRGVALDRGNNRYRAHATLAGKKHYGGYFPITPEGLADAERAAVALRRELFTHASEDRGHPSLSA